MAELLLAGVDGSAASQNALRWATDYAETRDCEILAAHVITYSVEFRRDLPPTGLTAWRQKLRDQLEGEWMAALRDTQVRYRTTLVESDSVDGGLLELAAASEVSLIVLGAHAGVDLKDRLLGAVTYKVSHRADRPVVIVPAAWSATSAR